MSYFSGIYPGLRTGIITLSWLPVVYTFSNHVYQPCQISGMSMTPTFNPGVATTEKDIAIVQKFNVRRPNSLERGDVVMFRSPQNPEKLLTKRVVGLQGDEILAKSPPYPKKVAKVPRNHLWVEGDNAFHSIDSNNFGPISQALVTGKVVAIVYPFSRFGADIRKGGRDARKPPEKENVKYLDDFE